MQGGNERDSAPQAEMKKAVLLALEENDLDRVVSFSSRNKSVLSILVRLAYDKETLVGWRAILAAGRIASAYTTTNYEHLRVTIRKLLWMLSDESGGIGWAAPELLGEIVRSDPKTFADIVPLIAEIFYIEERNFRAGVIYALKRIAEVQPESVQPHKQIAVKGLDETESLSRIYALELITQLSLAAGAIDKKTLDAVKVLLHDEAEAWVYVENGFLGIQVNEMAKKCIETINKTCIVS